MTRLIDLTGKRFGRFVVISRGPNLGSCPAWNCVCDCGEKKLIRGFALRKGASSSCGCLQKELAAERKSTHGLSKHQLYNTWLGIRKRCNNPNHKYYYRYGGRGIKVCARWNKSFEAFLSDMGERPSCKHTVDRIDNDGDYTPENCRWATQKEQMNNTSINDVIEFNGDARTQTEWSLSLGGNEHLVKDRIKSGWSLEKALTVPARDVERLITFKGKTKNLTGWAEDVGLSLSSLHQRLNALGWPVEKALTTPSRRF